MLTIIILHTDIVAPNLNIVEDGESFAGETFALLCKVTLPDGLTTEPQISWLSPEGNILTSEGDVTVGSRPILGNPFRLTTYVIQFSPFLTSHGGTYTCRVTLTSPFGTIEQSVSMAWNISVRSKLWIIVNQLALGM